MLERLPSNPMVTVPPRIQAAWPDGTAARKAIEFLQDLGVLREVTGRQRGRVYAYHEYLETLIGDDG